MDRSEAFALTLEERTGMIRRILDLERRLVQAKGVGSPWWDLESQLAALRKEYVRRVPRPVVSYDPIGEQSLRLGVDCVGLDSPWWDVDGPGRPTDEPLPLTWYAANGAMRLQKPYERWGSPVKVGPLAPYVVPRVLERPGVVAVVSTVPVGQHTGWLIVYYSPWPNPPPGKRVNEWGRECYRVRSESGQLRVEKVFDFEPEWDFDLASWIAAGKLLWTPPGEPGAEARSVVAGCPYLGLLGRRDPKGMGILAFGKLRYTEISKDLLRVSNPNAE